MIDALPFEFTRGDAGPVDCYLDGRLVAATLETCDAEILVIVDGRIAGTFARSDYRHDAYLRLALRQFMAAQATTPRRHAAPNIITPRRRA